MLLCIIVVKVGGCIAGCKLYNFFSLNQIVWFPTEDVFLWGMIFESLPLISYSKKLSYVIQLRRCKLKKREIKEERDNNSDKNNYALTNEIIFSKYNSGLFCPLRIDTRIYRHSEGNPSLHTHFWWSCPGF